MREELFDKLVDLPVLYLDTHSHGDVMSRMTNDIEDISSTVSQSLPSLCSGVLTVTGTVAIMIWYCWQLALLSCVMVGLTIAATRFLSGRVRKYSRQRQQLLGQLNNMVVEMISGYRTVVAYNHQEQTSLLRHCRAAHQGRYPDGYHQRRNGMIGDELYRQHRFCDHRCFRRVFLRPQADLRGCDLFLYRLRPAVQPAD